MSAALPEACNIYISEQKQCLLDFSSHCWASHYDDSAVLLMPISISAASKGCPLMWTHVQAAYEGSMSVRLQTLSTFSSSGLGTGGVYNRSADDANV